MIEMIGDLVAAILGKIKTGDYKMASDQLSNIYYDILKEDASYFKSIPEEDLTFKLLHKHNYSNGHLEILAELFNAEAELSLAEGNTTGCIEFSKKALILFKFIDSELKTYTPDRIKKMECLQKRINDLLP